MNRRDTQCLLLLLVMAVAAFSSTAVASPTQFRLRIFDPSGLVKTQVTNDDAVRSSVRAVRQPAGSAMLVGNFTKAGATKFCSLTRALARRGSRLRSPQHFAFEVAGRIYTRPWIDYRAFPNGLCGSPGFQVGGMRLSVARSLVRLIRGG
jgi:hypothetical protein